MAPRRAAALRGGDQSLRDHLISAAERLIARSGTRGLTVREVAREAQVADGVLYNHFADKEELLAYALQAHVRAAARELADLPRTAGEGTVEANLRTYLTRGLALHEAVLPAFAGVLGEPRVLAHLARLPDAGPGGGDLRTRLADYLRAEQRLGRVAADARPDAVAALVVGVCHDMVLEALLNPGTPATADPAGQSFDDLVDTLMRALSPVPG